MNFPLKQSVRPELRETRAAGEPSAQAEQRPVCLIHVGYHRTGTSFLQTELFPLIASSALTQDLDEANRNAADTTLRTAIFSSEFLSSDLVSDKPELAAELVRQFPGARILIGIRSQYSLVRGVYHLHVKGGGTEDYEAFVERCCGQLFDFAGLVDAYRGAFGPDNVFVLPHEDLSRDPLGQMAALLRFMGSDPAIALKVCNQRVKPSAGEPTMRMLHLRNRLIAPLRKFWPSAHRQIVYRGLPGSRLIDWAFAKLLSLPRDSVRPIIRNAYADSNARLFSVLGKSIADYDYPQPGSN